MLCANRYLWWKNKHELFDCCECFISPSYVTNNGPYLMARRLQIKGAASNSNAAFPLFPFTLDTKYCSQDRRLNVFCQSASSATSTWDSMVWWFNRRVAKTTDEAIFFFKEIQLKFTHYLAIFVPSDFILSRKKSLLIHQFRIKTTQP